MSFDNVKLRLKVKAGGLNREGILSLMMGGAKVRRENTHQMVTEGTDRAETGNTALRAGAVFNLGLIPGLCFPSVK